MPNFASQFERKLAPMKQFSPEVLRRRLGKRLAQVGAGGAGVEAVHVGDDLDRPVHPLLGHHELQAGVAIEDAAEDHHPDAAAGPPRASPSCTSPARPSPLYG